MAKKSELQKDLEHKKKFDHNMDISEMVALLKKHGNSLVYKKLVDFKKGHKGKYKYNKSMKDYISTTTAVHEIKKENRQIAVFRSLSGKIETKIDLQPSHYYTVIMMPRIVKEEKDGICFFVFDSRIHSDVQTSNIPDIISEFIKLSPKTNRKCYISYGTQKFECDCGKRNLLFIDQIMALGKKQTLTEQLMLQNGNWEIGRLK